MFHVELRAEAAEALHQTCLIFMALAAPVSQTGPAYATKKACVDPYLELYIMSAWLLLTPTSIKDTFLHINSSINACVAVWN